MKQDVQNIHNWLNTAGHQFKDITKLPLAISLVEEELQELKEAIQNNDEQEVIDAVIDLNWVINNVTYFQGILPLDIELYNELVSISNWSKFCSTEQEAIDSVEAYREGNHTDKIGVRIDAHYEKVGNYYVIKRYDGKVLKSLYYKSVTELLKEKEYVS